MIILDRERQSEKASFPILVTLSEITILTREQQPANALSPMLFTLLGMIYDSIS